MIRNKMGWCRICRGQSGNGMDSNPRQWEKEGRRDASASSRVKDCAF